MTTSGEAADGSGDLGDDVGFLSALAEMRDAPDNARRAAARRLGAAMRVLIERTVGTSADAEHLEGAAAQVEDLAAAFAEFPQGSVYDSFAEAANAGSMRGFFDNSPVQGMANPLAPPVDLRQVDDTIVGTVRFGSAYEGPPGHVHGGHVAAVFDEVLGAAQNLGGKPGMTAFLHVDYRSPTPLDVDLRFVGRIDRVEGRKLFTVGESWAGDTRCAEAQAMFVSFGPERFGEFLANR